MFTCDIPVNEKWSIRIRSNTYSIIRKKIATSSFIFSETEEKDIVFELFIRVFSKKIKHPSLNTYKGWPSFVDISSDIYSDKIIFSLRTPLGSRAKIDYLRRKAYIKVIKEDIYLEHFLLRVTKLILRLIKSFSIHAVWMKGRRDFLLIGKSGSGKSTLGGLLSTVDKRNKIMRDDFVFIFPFKKKVYASVLKDDRRDFYIGKITHLFFVEKKVKEKSRIIPISSKEAFSRITLCSDVILKKNDPQIDYRLDVLHRLVSQAKPFVIINGGDLKDNPKKIKNILHNVIYLS